MSEGTPLSSEGSRAPNAAGASGVRLGPRTLWAMLGGTVPIIGVLLGILYSSLSDDLHAVREDVLAVREDVRAVQQSLLSLSATAATAEKVNEAILRVGDIEQRLRETHDTVLRNGDKLDELTAHVDAISSDVNQIRGQLGITGKASPGR